MSSTTTEVLISERLDRVQQWVGIDPHPLVSEGAALLSSLWSASTPNPSKRRITLWLRKADSVLEVTA